MSLPAIQISLAYAILKRFLAPIVAAEWIQQPLPVAACFLLGLIVSRTLDVQPSTKLGKWIVCLAGLQMLAFYWTIAPVYTFLAQKYSGSVVAQLHVALAGVYTLAFGLGTLQPRRGMVGSLLGVLAAVVFTFFKLGDGIMLRTLVEPCKAWFGLATSVLVYACYLLAQESLTTGPKMKRTNHADIGVATSRRPVLALTVLIPIVAMAWLKLANVSQCCSGTACYPAKIPGANYTIIDQAYSTSGYLQVVEEPDEPLGRGVRILRSNHAFLGGYFLDTKESVFANFYLQALGRFAEIRTDNQPLNVLILGMGAGCAAGKYIESRDKVHIVEYDAKVVEYAQKYFPWVERGYPVSVMRAQDFVKQAPTAFYDIVVCDVYPAEFDLDEMVPEILRILRHGISGSKDRPYAFIYNWVGRIHGHNANVITQRLMKHFASVEAYSETASSNVENTTTIDNLVFYAASEDLDLDLDDQVRGGYIGPLQEYINNNVEDLSLNMVFHRMPRPTDTLSEWEFEDVREQHYSSMLQMFGPDYWVRF